MRKEIKAGGGCKGSGGSRTGWSMRRTASECSCSSGVGQQVIGAEEGVACQKRLARGYWMQAMRQKEGSRQWVEAKEKEGKQQRVVQVT